MLIANFFQKLSFQCLCQHGNQSRRLFQCCDEICQVCAGFFRRLHIPRRIDSIFGVERSLKFLGVYFPVLIQDMCIYIGDHINLRMAGIPLCRFQVTKASLQLVSCTGVPQGMEHNIRYPEKDTEDL